MILPRMLVCVGVPVPSPPLPRTCPHAIPQTAQCALGQELLPHSCLMQEERESFQARYMDHGFVDAFRQRFPEHVGYTYWSYRFNLRARNKGWRLDYFLVGEKGGREGLKCRAWLDMLQAHWGSSSDGEEGRLRAGLCVALRLPVPTTRQPAPSPALDPAH